MFQKLLRQFQKFSRENWWIYIIFFIALLIVFLTGNGNMGEILFIFILNISGNLYILLMQDAYKDGRFRTGSTFLIIGNSIYSLVAVYSAIFNAEYQYILWQVAFQLSGLKAFFYYHKGWEGKMINHINMLVLCSILMFIGVYVLDISGYQIVQSFGFGLTIMGLISISDTRRYFTILFGTAFVMLGSGLGLYGNFIVGNIFGITLSFAILSMSTLMFYLKLFPEYIRRLKKLK